MLLTAIIIIQFIPVDRDNPEVQEEIAAPAEVKTILQRSCYDCHSNKTEWPFYSYIAPVSWFVANDVQEAREDMNFTEWNKYDAEDKSHFREDILELVEKGAMPLKSYKTMHPDSEVSQSEIEIIRQWVKQEAGGEFEHEHSHDHDH